MPDHVLLLGRTGVDLDEVRGAMDTTGLALYAGRTLDDVEAAMAEAPIDTVIMGAGIDLDARLAIVRHVFERSDATTVHMKDRDSAKEAMVPFVVAVLSGLRGGF